MANTKQQRKRVKIAERERTENLKYKSRIKTMFKTLTIAAREDKERASRLAIELISLIDKAASRGVIHENNAARKKSRVSSMVKLAGEPASPRARRPGMPGERARKTNDPDGPRPSPTRKAVVAAKQRLKRKPQPRPPRPSRRKPQKRRLRKPRLLEESPAEAPQTADETPAVAGRKSPAEEVACNFF